MFETLGIGDQASVFKCPNCKQIINTSDQQCRFCSAPIDRIAAEAAAAALARVNQACSDATYIRHLQDELYLSWSGMLWMPSFILFLVITPMKFRWWVRFGAIETDDPAFRRAREIVVESGGPRLLIATFVVWIVGPALLVSAVILVLLHK
jgi:hypothetical protein